MSIALGEAPEPPSHDSQDVTVEMVELVLAAVVAGVAAAVGERLDENVRVGQHRG